MPTISPALSVLSLQNIVSRENIKGNADTKDLFKEKVLNGLISLKSLIVKNQSGIRVKPVLILQQTTWRFKGKI
jgi:hypothetical protein